jgi:tetratricopeptide (TPR) repeat protein
MFSCTVPVVWVAGLASLVPPVPDENDPVCRLQSEYRREGDVLRADRSIDRRPIYEDWFERLQQATQRHPDSDCAGWATRESRALLNGLGRYRESLGMLEEGLAKATTDASRGYYLQQMGEVSFRVAFAEKDSQLAHKCIDSYARLRELEKTPNAGWPTGFEYEGTLQAVVLKNHLGAADAFAAAYRVYTQLPEAQQRNASDVAGAAGPRSEHWLQQAAAEYARVDRPQEAIAAINELEKISGRRQSMGDHLLSVLGNGAPEHSPKALYDHIAAWLDEHPDEPRGPEVILLVGQGYERLGNTESAIATLEDLLRKAENQAFREQWRTVTEMAAAHLGRLYIQSSQLKKMENLVERRRDWNLK